MDSEGEVTISSLVRAFLLCFAGLLVIEAAWIAVVPPFRGVDEHDHVFRAASVARGHWRPDYVHATNGRGDLIPVPADIVKAARPVCESLSYTKHDDCNGVAEVGSGQVLVASAASRYNPIFYWVIGAPARWFRGESAAYAMRAAGALLCSALLALALVISRRLGDTRWPMLGLLVATSPIALYSFALPAANGLELAAAALLWTCLLALRRARQPGTQSRLLLIATGAAAVLATVRSLGPVWLALIVATWSVVAGWSRIIDLVRQHRRLAPACVLVVGVATLAGVAWTLTASTNSPVNQPSHHMGPPWATLPAAIPFWVMQCIGAFPTGVEVGPPAMYVLTIALYAGLFVLARSSIRAARIPLILVATVSLAIPIAATILTFDRLGLAWQGRYGLPYAIGLFLVLSWAADDKAQSPSEGRYATAAGWLWFGSCLLGLVGVIHNVAGDHVARTWSAPHIWWLALGGVVGSLLLAAGLVPKLAFRTRQRTRQVESV